MDILKRQGDNEAHLRDYLFILRRRSTVAVLFFVTIVLAVTLGSFIMKPVYRAKTTLLIDLESPNVLTATGMVEMQSQNYYSYKEYYQSQQEIITSLPIVKRVFDEFGLAGSREYVRAKEPIKKFLKTITVQPVRDTRLMELCVDNKDPVLAAKIANRIAEIYVKRNLYYISKNELLNLLKNEYLKLEGKVSEYTNIYKEGHPEMIRLRQEMSEMVEKIESEKKSSVRQDYSETEELLNYKQALEGLKANNISVLAPAEVPILPLRPKKLLNIAIAIIIGFFGGIAMAFFFEYLDDTVKDLSDIERLVEWPFLGSVPTISAAGHMMGELEKDILVHIKPKDPIAEAIRSIRTSIIFSSTEERPLRAVAITSAAPQEGKTTTVCNIGIAMAQSNKRVLLVDADMRNPRLHEVFKKENKEGLSTYLSGQASLKEVIQSTDIENLSLVTSGMHPPNPSELLASHRMAEFVKEAKEKFDFVLFDTPPITILTDPAIISRIADGLIMVIESGKTSKRVIPRIGQILENAKARVVGVIFNKISIRTSDYYYYYSRYYGK